MSDHLPLVMDIQLNQNFLKTTDFLVENPISFPEGNVTDASLSVKVNLPFLEKVHSIEIYNALGQQILKKRVSSEITRLDVSTLSNGIYYLKPRYGKVQKFIVVHWRYFVHIFLA